MNNLQIFKGNKIEIIEYNNQVLFNPYDVANILDIKNIRDSLKNFNTKQLIKLTNSDVGFSDIRKLNNRGEIFLTESGLYKLIFKSNKPKAEEFANWVTDEVLPTIRKQGTYSIINQNTQQDNIIKMLVQSQNNMLSMIQALNNKIDNIKDSKLLEQTNDNIQKNTTKSKKLTEEEKLQKIIQRGTLSARFKILKFPTKIIDMVDLLLSQEHISYTYIRKILKEKGYDISYNSIVNYHKAIQGGF